MAASAARDALRALTDRTGRTDLGGLSASRAAAQPASGPVEPVWLHTAGQIAGVALMIELLIALLIVAALMFGLAYGMWWLSRNVVPVIGEYSEQAQRYIAIAERGSDRVAHGVASFHGARAGIAAGLRAFFLPGGDKRRAAPTTQPLSSVARVTTSPGAAGVSTPTPHPAPEPVVARAQAGDRARPNSSQAAPNASAMSRARGAATQAVASGAARLIAATPRVAGRAQGVVAGRVAGS